MKAQLFLILFLLGPVFFLFAFMGFRVVHNLFMVMKENEPDMWIELGKPWCKISIPLDQENISIPPKVIMLMYLWPFKAPSWAVSSQKGREVYLKYRMFFTLGIIVGVAIFLGTPLILIGQDI